MFGIVYRIGLMYLSCRYY